LDIIIKPAFTTAVKFIPNVQRLVDNIEINKNHWSTRFGEYEERRKNGNFIEVNGHGELVAGSASQAGSSQK